MKTLNAGSMVILAAGVIACTSAVAGPAETTLRIEATDVRGGTTVTQPVSTRSVEFPLPLWNSRPELDRPAVDRQNPRVNTPEHQKDVGAGTFWIKRPDQTAR